MTGIKAFYWVLLCILQLQLYAINADIFKQKLREPVPQWMIEQISKDLAPYKKELSRKFLDLSLSHGPVGQ